MAASLRDNNNSILFHTIAIKTISELEYSVVDSLDSQDSRSAVQNN